MLQILAAVVAVIGTLAGATLTHLFQWQALSRAERSSRERQLRDARASAYSDFAAAVTDFRRSQNDRWHLEHDDPGSRTFNDMRAESYRLRSAATSAMCKVRLLSGTSGLAELARTAMDATILIQDAIDESDRVERGAKARRSVDDFLDRGARDVQ